MFTGIITHIGEIKKLDFSEGNDCLIALKIFGEISRKTDIGCSIACDGICLTLIKKEQDLFYFQASKETCEITNLKNWQIGKKINVEFALKVGDEFGGHIVSGHIDGICKLIEIEKIQDSWKMKFLVVNQDLMKFVAKKGSICMNGVSLTINNVGENFFEVNIIQHTFQNTNFHNIKIADFLNLEVDLLARYVLNNN